MYKAANEKYRYLLGLVLFAGIITSCKPKNVQVVDQSAINKAFVMDMLGSKKQLKDYPGKASEDFTVYEPSSLPFGGTYKGLNAFEKFYPGVRKFYDFSRFELKHVYADGDVVFAIAQAGIANTNDSILLCEQFTFKEGKLSEVRLFIHDFEGKPIHTLVNEHNKE